MKKEVLLRLSHGPEQHVLTISILMCQRPTTATPYQIFCFKCDLCDFYLTSFGPQTEEENSTRKTLLQVSEVLIATSFQKLTFKIVNLKKLCIPFLLCSAAVTTNDFITNEMMVFKMYDTRENLFLSVTQIKVAQM